MGRSRKTAPALIDLPVRASETGDITVIAETAKGSHNKYKYHPECRALRFKAGARKFERGR